VIIKLDIKSWMQFEIKYKQTNFSNNFTANHSHLLDIESIVYT